MNNFTRQLIILYFVLTLVFVVACDLKQLTPGTHAWLLRNIERSNVRVTDEIVGRYIRTYAILQQKDPQLLKLVNCRDSLNENQCAYLRVVETLVQQGGFKDFPDFVCTDAKIRCVFYLVQHEATPQTLPATALGSIPVSVPAADEVETHQAEEPLLDNKFPAEQVIKLTSPSEIQVVKKNFTLLRKIVK